MSDERDDAGACERMMYGHDAGGAPVEDRGGSRCQTRASLTIALHEGELTSNRALIA